MGPKHHDFIPVGLRPFLFVNTGLESTFESFNKLLSIDFADMHICAAEHTYTDGKHQ